MIKFTRYRYNNSDILGKRVFLKGDPYSTIKIYGPFIVYQIVRTNRIILVKASDVIPAPRVAVRCSFFETVVSERPKYLRRVYFSSKEKFEMVLKQAISIEEIRFGNFKENLTGLMSRYEFELYD